MSGVAKNSRCELSTCRSRGVAGPVRDSAGPVPFPAPPGPSRSLAGQSAAEIAMTKRYRAVARARATSTTQTIFVAAPPRAVYDLVADTGRWPYIFTPTVHVQRLYGTETYERLRLWAVADGAVRSWISQRTLDPRELRIGFRQENPAAPIAAMAGEWVFAALPGNATFVVLLHKFRAVGDDPGDIARIA